MSKKKLLTTGNAFKRTDGRWGGVVWYLDGAGQRKRKAFSGTTKAGVTKKMKDYVESFNAEIVSSDEANKTLQESMTNWLQVFKFPSVERTTYDRCECTAENQIYPFIGDKPVGDVMSADIKCLLNDMMAKDYAYTTVKKVRTLLGEYFRYLTEQEVVAKNPMNSVPMMKKSNFMAAQEKEDLPESESITVFTDEELEKFKAEASRRFGNDKRVYQQSAAYILMLNTGLRTGEVLGLLNCDIDLEHRVLHLERGVKEVWRREGVESQPGRDVKVGKLKTKTSKRSVPLNDTAIAAIEELRGEFYFGEDSPLIPDENGDFTRPVNFRKRYYRILKAAGIELKGLHSLRHTFATRLVNGVKQANGTVKALTPRQVADILGHSTSEITERYYVKKDTARLNGITDDFNF